MSDPKLPDHDEGASTDPPRADASVAAGDDDTALDELDEVGVDGLVARISRSGSEADPVAVARKPRPPWISAGVVALAGYLLITMWPEFRYWMRSSEPLELGHASSFVVDGRVPGGYTDEYVRLSGTPDVQSALRLNGRDSAVGYLRVAEGGGQLFAAVPRDETSKSTAYEGTFVGRMRRLGDDPAWALLEQYFTTQGVSQTVDISPEALVDGLNDRDGETLQFRTAEGSITVAASEPLRLVTRVAQARVELGVESYRSAEDAEAAVAALGHPWTRVRPTSSTPAFYDFVVQIPPEQWAEAGAALVAKAQAPPKPADPRQGAIVLPLSASYTVEAGALGLAAGGIAFDHNSAAGLPVTYVVAGDRLEPLERGPETIVVPLTELRAVRVEQVIRLDPDGYVVAVGVMPSSSRALGSLWLVVLGIALANAASLAIAWRRRA